MKINVVFYYYMVFNVLLFQKKKHKYLFTFHYKFNFTFFFVFLLINLLINFSFHLEYLLPGKEFRMKINLFVKFIIDFFIVE